MDNQNDQELEFSVEHAGVEEENIFYNGRQIRKLEERLRLQKRIESGYGWFYWIAGLSLVNTLAYMFGMNWSFILGLGITQVIDGLAYELSGLWRVIALIVDFIIAGMFVLFGVLGSRRHTWAFIAGMIFYILDGIIFILFKDWVGAAFHLFALYGLYRALKANMEMKKIKKIKSASVS